MASHGYRDEVADRAAGAPADDDDEEEEEEEEEYEEEEEEDESVAPHRRVMSKGEAQSNIDEQISTMKKERALQAQKKLQVPALARSRLFSIFFCLHFEDAHPRRRPRWCVALHCGVVSHQPLRQKHWCGTRDDVSAPYRPPDHSSPSSACLCAHLDPALPPALLCSSCSSRATFSSTLGSTRRRWPISGCPCVLPLPFL